MAVTHEFEFPLTKLRQETTTELLDALRTVLPILKKLEEFDIVERLLHSNGNGNGNGHKPNGVHRQLAAASRQLPAVSPEDYVPQFRQPKKKAARADYDKIRTAAVDIIRALPGITTADLVARVQALGATPRGMTPVSAATAIKKVLKQSSDVRLELKEGYKGGLSYFLVGPAIPPAPDTPPLPPPPADEPPPLAAAPAKTKSVLEFKDLEDLFMETLRANDGKGMTRAELFTKARMRGFPEHLGKKKNPLGNAVSQMLRRMQEWKQLRKVTIKNGPDVFHLVSQKGR